MRGHARRHSPLTVSDGGHLQYAGSSYLCGASLEKVAYGVAAMTFSPAPTAASVMS